VKKDIPKISGGQYAVILWLGIIVFIVIKACNYETDNHRQNQQPARTNKNNLVLGELQTPDTLKATHGNPTCDYEILFQHEYDIDGLPKSGITLQLLVKEKTTKSDIMYLLYTLNNGFKIHRMRFDIRIFDSRKAWIEPEEYSKYVLSLGGISDKQFYNDPVIKKYEEHFLANAAYNQFTGYNEITWLAKNRDH
jgi:hypothetical protein